MKYQEAVDYLESLNVYGIIPGLDSIRRLCEELGNPQKALSFVHIAGTNGKGSVLAYISTILKCAGYRVGRFMSPAIFQYREMIQVNEKSIPQTAFCRGVEIVREACDRLVERGFPHPTCFEAETALAFWYYREKKCDMVVLECGMGGLGDTTNIIENTCISVITSISMDHMKFLGHSLADIAKQKAGIMKPGRPVVTLNQAPEVMEVLKQEAFANHCPLVVADCGQLSKIRYGLEAQRFQWRAMQNLEIGMAGRFQVENALLALQAVEVLCGQGFLIKEAAIRKGLRETRWPGRFQVIDKKPIFIVDGAHNEDAARKLADSIEFYFTNKRIIYIMGVLRDKEYDKVIALTHRYADQIITVTPPHNPRGMSAYDLALAVAKEHPRVTAADSLEEAVEISYLLAGKEDVILAFGSLSYLGRLLQIVQNRKPAQRKGRQHGKS